MSLVRRWPIRWPQPAFFRPEVVHCRQGRMRAALAASIFWMVWVPKKRQQTLLGWMVWGSKAADPFLDGVLRGVDTDDFLFIQPDNGEQAESVDTFVRSSAVNLRGNQTETASKGVPILLRNAHVACELQ